MWFGIPEKSQHKSSDWQIHEIKWLPAGCLVVAWIIAQFGNVVSTQTEPEAAEKIIHEGEQVETLPTHSDRGLHESEGTADGVTHWPIQGQSTSLEIHGHFSAKVAKRNAADPNHHQHLLFVIQGICDSVIEQVTRSKAVELRRFRQVSEVFFLSDDDLSGSPILDEGVSTSFSPRANVPHVGLRRIPVQHLSAALTTDSRTTGDTPDEAYWDIAPLASKVVRLTHRLGSGVESVQAVRGELTPRDIQWLRHAKLTWNHRTTHADSIPPNTSLDQLLPTTMRMIPPWSNVRRASSSEEQLAIKLTWTDDQQALERWLPPGHLLRDHYKLISAPEVQLKMSQVPFDAESFGGIETSISVLRKAGKAATPRQPRLQAGLIPSFFDFVPHGSLGLEDSPDVAIAMLLLLVLSTLLFAVGVRISATGKWSSLCALANFGLLMAFIHQLHGQITLANYLPLSNVIALGNWLPLGASVLAGLLYGHSTIPRARRLLLASSLLCAGWYAVMCTVSPILVHSENRFANGVCMQSTPATCSAGAVVSLLDIQGIVSDEAEMARLCLTGRYGTNMLGIYRGLKLKTAGTPFRVEAVQCSFPELQGSGLWPMLIPVKQESLTPLTFGPPRKRRISDLISGTAKPAILEDLLKRDHCVVLYGMSNDGQAIVGDPSNQTYGRVRWTKEKLEKSWRGQGFRLVSRESP